MHHLVAPRRIGCAGLELVRGASWRPAPNFTVSERLELVTCRLCRRALARKSHAVRLSK